MLKLLYTNEGNLNFSLRYMVFFKGKNLNFADCSRLTHKLNHDQYK